MQLEALYSVTLGTYRVFTCWFEIPNACVHDAQCTDGIISSRDGSSLGYVRREDDMVDEQLGDC